MKISINKAFPFKKFRVAELKQKTLSGTQKSETESVTATDFEVFIQSINGDLVSSFIPGFLYRMYFTADIIPVSEIKNKDKIILENGKKFEVEGFQLQEAQPGFKPFWKLEVRAY